MKKVWFKKAGLYFVKIPIVFSVFACGNPIEQTPKKLEPNPDVVKKEKPGPIVSSTDPKAEENTLSGPDYKDIFTSDIVDPKPDQQLSLTIALQPVQTCTEAETYLKNLIYLELKSQYENQLRWFRSYDERLEYDSAEPMTGAAAENTISQAETDNASKSAAPDDFTITNNQVQGVDEGDFVKNTGTHIFMVVHDRLEIIKSWPADSMETLGSLKFTDRPVEMVRTENQKLLIAANPKIKAVEANSELQSGIEPAFGPDIAYYRPSYDGNSVRLYVVDISDMTNPQIEKSVLLQGSYKGLRLVGNSARTILNQYLGHPKDLKNIDWRKTRDLKTKEELKSYLQTLLDENKAILDSYNYEQLTSYNRWWYGNYILENEQDRIPADTTCASVYKPTVPTAEGLTSVVSFDLTDSTVHRTTLLTRSEHIYASKTSLYTSSTTWRNKVDNSYKPQTQIHKFDTSDPKVATYKATGVIDGSILNQFAMDEFQGNLRIAATVRVDEEAQEPKDPAVDTDMVIMDRRWRPTTTVNVVSILSESEGVLKIVGQTDPLAKGERIYSVRFMGAIGYVVTFRQVDPLYTMDLSDPTNPIVLGELKIPGFSNYLHPISDTHLIGVGQEADPNTGRTQGLKVSVFDVSDLKNPKEQFNYVMDNLKYSSSSAQYNHKAFTYFASKGLLAIPVTGYAAENSENFWWSRYQSSLNILKIDLTDGISKLGEVTMTDIYQGEELPWYRWSRFAQVERSIFADDIVYAISHAGIRATNLSDLTSPVGEIGFDCDEACQKGFWY